MRIPSTADPEVQEAFRSLWAAHERIGGTGNADFLGRRIINAGPAVADTDYVIKAQLDAALAKASTDAAKTAQAAVSSAPGGEILIGTHSERIAHVASPLGTGWYETDRTVIYVAVSTGWRYVAGVMRTAPGDVPVTGGGGDAPGTPTAPHPADGATDVGLTPTLSWSIAT